MADVTLNCCDCKLDFSFSDGEQRFFAERQLAPPRRCKACRSNRKNERKSSDKPAVPTGAISPPARVPVYEPPPPSFMDGPPVEWVSGDPVEGRRHNNKKLRREKNRRRRFDDDYED